jgi:hypothetical protein
MRISVVEPSSTSSSTFILCKPLGTPFAPPELGEMQGKVAAE